MRSFSAAIRASISAKRSRARSSLRLMASSMRAAMKSISVVTAPTLRSSFASAAAWRSCASENERVSHRPLVSSSKIGASSVLSTTPAAIPNEMAIAAVSGDLARRSVGPEIMATVLLKWTNPFQQKGVSKPLMLMRAVVIFAATGLPKRQRLAPHHQSPGGDHDPASVLPLDCFHAAKPRRGCSYLHLNDAVAAFDQRGAVIDAAHDVVV